MSKFHSIFPDIHIGPDDGREDQDESRLLPEDNSPDDDSDDDIRPTPAYVVGLLGFDPDEFNNEPEPLKADSSDELAKHSYGVTMAVFPDDSEAGRLMADLRASIDPSDLAGQGLEPTAHVTLRYGILPGADLTGLRLYLGSIKPFEIEFGETSTFPPSPSSDDAAVIKVDVTSQALEDMNAVIAEHCDFKPANFEYHPHATIAYVDPMIAFKYIGDDRMSGVKFLVTAITVAMPGSPDEVIPLGGAVKTMNLCATDNRMAKQAEHPETAQARHKLQADVFHFLQKTARDLGSYCRRVWAVQDYADKVAKSGGDSGLNAFLAGMPPIRWEDLQPDIYGSLNTVARTAAGRAVAELNINDADLLSDVNDVASDWAGERAAELIGMKRTASGRLVENPDAQWTISDRTRDDIKQIVTDAFKQKMSMSDLVDTIQGAGTFSESRAGMIAATEVSRAENQGNLAGWRGTGIVEKVDWQLSADHDDADNCECDDNADGGPYDLDDVPECPAHPGCICSLAVAQLTGQDEPEDEN